MELDKFLFLMQKNVKPKWTQMQVIIIAGLKMIKLIQFEEDLQCIQLFKDKIFTNTW